jgi:hypothetical protein
LRRAVPVVPEVSTSGWLRALSWSGRINLFREAPLALAGWIVDGSAACKYAVAAVTLTSDKPARNRCAR